jgi:hypothetical protein
MDPWTEHYKDKTELGNGGQGTAYSCVRISDNSPFVIKRV